MPTPKAIPIEASNRARAMLEQIERRRNAPTWLVTRVGIVLRALDGHSNSAITEIMGLDRNQVRRWRSRWQETSEQRAAVETEATDKELETFIVASLRDEYRSGTPPKFSAEQVVQIVAIACEDPQASGYPISHWTEKEIRAEAMKRGIVESISVRQVGRFLKRGRLETPSKPLLVEHDRD